MCRAARLAKPRVLRASLLLSIDGWDDRVRIGGGERGVGILGPHAGLEPQLAYVSLLIQSCRYFSRTLNATGGDAALASKMDGIADSLAAKLRARPSAGQHRPGRLQTSCLAGSAFSHRYGCRCVAGGAPYWKDYGVHAASNLISAGVPTAAELPQIAANVFNDSTTICSWSPFNTFCKPTACA